MWLNRSHRRSALVAAHLLFAAVLLASVSNASGQNRTYNIVDYPANETDANGATDTLSGTIITDGKLGTLTPSDVSR